ncbi:unnamed protein product [Paramecium sonneborni]|uniref:Uncharacterized protein n=1 Tax=Paramecium sonneborni TaxID=65129 RepID=A0A8S1K973_9CILI|nr:unnamed protein product [Paramecium sonneborni]
MYQNNQQHQFPNHQIQSQQQKSKNTEMNSQQEYIKYTVRQDFLNVIGIAVDYNTVLEKFQNDTKQDELLKVMQNRLILQVNLSNSIHSDLYHQFKNSPNMQQLLKAEKEQAKKNLKLLDQEKFYQATIVLLKKYEENCLVDQPIIKHEALNLITCQPQFNPETIGKVIGSINTTDQKYQDIQNGKFETEELSKETIFKYIDERKQNAKMKLNNNPSQESNFGLDCGCQLI